MLRFEQKLSETSGVGSALNSNQTLKFEVTKKELKIKLALTEKIDEESFKKQNLF